MENKILKVEVLSEEEEVPGQLKNVFGYYEKIRSWIRNWAESKGGKRGVQAAEVVLMAPDLFMLMVRLVRDPRINALDRALILGGITYFMTPIDILPEGFLGPGGLLDDIVLAVFILNRVLNSNRDVVLEHWSGSGSLLHYLQEITASAQELLGRKTFKKLNKYFNFLLKRKF